MILFENGEAEDNKILDVQGLGLMSASKISPSVVVGGLVLNNTLDIYSINV